MTPKRRKSYLPYIVWGLLAAAAAGEGWYYFYWMKTPQYSLGLVQSALSDRDFDRFERHVDMKSVYSHGYDDIVAEELSEKDKNNPLAAALIKGLKSTAVKELIRETEERFRGDEPDTAKEKASARFLKNAENRIGTAALSLTDVVSVQREGDEATALLRIHDKALGRDFQWQIRMVKNPEGDWRIVEVTNFRAYLKERKEALQQS